MQRREMPPPEDNLLLSLLPADIRSRLYPRLEPVTYPLHKRLYESDEPINRATFPTRGLVSIVAVARDGTMVEVGLVGRDGLIGQSLALGAARTPLEAFVQVAPVQAWCLPALTMQTALARYPSFQRVVLRYIEWARFSTSQGLLCARLHHVEARLARWLLLAQDRMGGDDLPVTQLGLATMLAVQRPFLTSAAVTLRDAGLIVYRRGHIKILDRKNLEDAACECYGAITREYSTLLASVK
jgi:CRP-like cAMP-binding protein